MRTRRRPVLQDKTPVNTPQKPRAPAKPRLVPIVEIKTRLRRTGKVKQADNEHEAAVDAGDIGEHAPEPEEVPVAASKPRSPEPRERTRPSATAKGAREKGAGARRGDDAGRQSVSQKEGAARLADGDHTGKRKRTNAQEPVATNAGATAGTVPKPAKIRKTVAATAEALEPQQKLGTRSKFTRGRKNEDVGITQPTTRPADIQSPTATRRHVEPTGPSQKGKARANDDPTAAPTAKDTHAFDHGGGNRAPLRHISPAPSPTAGRKVLPVRRREPLQPTSVPSPQRASTPDTIPIADDDSSQSDAIKAIFDTPSPARIIRAPIPAQSTPMGGRLEKKFSPLPSLNVRGRQQSSIRRWNHGVSRAYSPLPPSSPPPPTPPTQEPVAGSSRLQPPSQPQPEEDNDYDMENAPARGPTYVRKERLSDDDPFGILAAEKKLKALRARRAAMIESSRAPGVVRAPLGTLALDEVPSSDVRIPEHLPTPLPSDDDHNIDDLYLDVDPRPARMVLDEEYDDEEDEDKENIPTADYDLNEDKENLQPPRLFSKNDNESEPPSLDLSLEGNSDAENGPLPPLGEAGDLPIAPLLAASAKKGLTTLFEPSSSSASPTHALRTPHKHRNAHQRSPLPTPNFSDTPLTARSTDRRDSSPSPVKPSVVRAGPSVVRKPLAPIEIEVDDALADSEEPPKVAGKKRTRAQAAVPSGSDSDPRAAVRRLESLLPKRSKTRVAVTARGAAPSRGRGRGRGAAAKGKGRAAPVESTSEGDVESDAEESDTSPPKAKKAKTTRGTGRARGTSRGRPRGRAAAPVSTRGRSVAPASTRGRTAAPVSASGRPASKRGRSTSKGKGKERAEEIDPEEDEERARKREERLEYFRQLQEYSIEKEDVYVI
ncbi:hypothetical protein VTO73DRAFT_8896 [Trametes versicolor]